MENVYAVIASPFNKHLVFLILSGFIYNFYLYICSKESNIMYMLSPSVRVTPLQQKRATQFSDCSRDVPAKKNLHTRPPEFLNFWRGLSCFSLSIIFLTIVNYFRFFLSCLDKKNKNQQIETYNNICTVQLKWAAEEINPKIRECLEVNTKLFLIWYMLIFLTKYVPLSTFTCLIGEKLVNILHKKW